MCQPSVGPICPVLDSMVILQLLGYIELCLLNSTLHLLTLIGALYIIKILCLCICVRPILDILRPHQAPHLLSSPHPLSFSSFLYAYLLLIAILLMLSLFPPSLSLHLLFVYPLSTPHILIISFSSTPHPSLSPHLLLIYHLSSCHNFHS